MEQKTIRCAVYTRKSTEEGLTARLFLGERHGLDTIPTNHLCASLWLVFF